MSIARVLTVTLGLALGALLSACGGVLSQHPLSDEESSVVDERLIGQWRVQDEPARTSQDQVEKWRDVRVWVGRGEPGQTRMELVVLDIDDGGRVQVQRVPVPICQIGADRYISFPLGDGAPTGYAILNYHMPDPNTLHLFALDEDLLAEEVESGRLRGTVKEPETPGARASTASRQVVLTEETEGLRAWMKAHGAECFRRDARVELKRVEPLTSESQEVSPPRAPAPPLPSYDAARTAAERLLNQKAYVEHVLPRRMGWVHDHLGKWIVLAGGKAFPVNDRGTAVAPAPSMEAAVAAAAAAVPEAHHRFVFRVGEAGDFRQSLGGCELPHVLGVWFLALLERPDVEFRALGAGKPIHFVNDGVRTEITVEGPDRRMYLRPEVGPPMGPGRADALYCLSTGYGGYAVLAADTAAGSGLHLWEVPGTIAIDGVFQAGVCRRARARLRFADTELDFFVPVAVWPEPESEPASD